MQLERKEGLYFSLTINLLIQISSKIHIKIDFFCFFHSDFWSYKTQLIRIQWTTTMKYHWLTSLLNQLLNNRRPMIKKTNHRTILALAMIVANDTISVQIAARFFRIVCNAFWAVLNVFVHATATATVINCLLNTYYYFLLFIFLCFFYILKIKKKEFDYWLM